MSERLERLRDKASRLPLHPGAYIMKNSDGKVIYVGKSRVLRNRVSQYFAKVGKHEPKTEKMVSCVEDFEYILTDTEMEALTLENKLIKLYKPKFNIKLKDDKSYPYIKINMNAEYPQMLVVRKRGADNAKYFGPYSGTFAAYEIIKTVRKNFGIACCKKKFPKDIGKERPCIYYQMGQCCGVCTGNVTAEEYKELYKDVISFLNGSFSNVKRSLEKKMYEASDEMRYEAAAKYRDRINALGSMWQRQKIDSAPEKERDVIALYSDECCTCISDLCIRDGVLCDSIHYEFPPEQISDPSSVVSFLCDLYLKKEYIPKEVLLSFRPDDEDAYMLEKFLCEKAGYKVELKIPEKGELYALCSMAYDNAKQHAKHYLAEKENNEDVLVRLCELLSLEVLPERIEAYDISNFGNDNITAGMICVKNAKLSKADYRLYNIKSTKTQDDYASMREALQRRLAHKEEPYPDLLLLDGGKGHVAVIKELLRELGADIPVFGMVKDEFHKTRALTDGDAEISIARERDVFIFIYRIQEEVHRFTISSMKRAKSKKLTASSLEEIEGIGPAKSAALLSHFKNMTVIKNADMKALTEVSGIGEKEALSIIKYFGE